LDNKYYADFARSRITELRIAKGVSEHRMSLDLDKCGSYIRSITSGRSLPSLGELFNICTYFEITPADFFAPLENADSTFSKLIKRLQYWSDDDLEKINTFADLIGK
jgi:transcriptional regulator with XRE-family HTH domain